MTLVAPDGTRAEHQLLETASFDPRSSGLMLGDLSLRIREDRLEAFGADARWHRIPELELRRDQAVLVRRGVDNCTIVSSAASPEGGQPGAAAARSVVLPAVCSTLLLSRTRVIGLDEKLAGERGLRREARSGAERRAEGTHRSLDGAEAFIVLPDYNQPGHARLTVAAPEIVVVDDLGSLNGVQVHDLVRGGGGGAEGARDTSRELEVLDLKSGVDSQFIRIARPGDSLSGLFSDARAPVLRSDHVEQRFALAPGAIYTVYAREAEAIVAQDFFEVAAGRLLVWREGGFADSGGTILGLDVPVAGQEFIEALSQSRASAYAVRLAPDEAGAILVQSHAKGVVVRPATDEERARLGAG